MMVYRTATTSDLVALADLRWEHWAEDTRAAPVVDQDEFRREFVLRLRPWLESGLLTVWVAEANGEIVANIYVERIVKVPKPNKLDDSYGYVTNVHTRHAHRNQGVGSELLKHVQAWALAQDLEFLVVWPSERSVSFYQRAGFAGRDALEFEVRPYAG